MTEARRAARLVRIMTVLVLLLAAGCASSAGDEPAAAAAGTETATAPADNDDDPAASNDAVEDNDNDGDDDDLAETAEGTDEPTINEVFVSPIGEALGVAQDEIAAAFETYVRDAEELTRQCMADAGFEYTPVPTNLNRAGQRQFELEETLSPEQFTEQYGFGIATLFELNFKDEGVINFVNQQFGPAPSAERSPGEQAAYDIALNGETIQGLSAEEAQEQLFGSGVGASLDGSCRDYGYSTAENPGAVYDGLFSLLGSEVDALTDRFDNDSRVRAALADWQACMAENGHAYESVDEIIDELQASTNQLANRYLSSSQVLTALGQAQQAGFTSMNNEDRAAFLEEVGALQGFSWVPEVQAEVDDLIRFELDVAATSATCSDEELFNAVRLELETAFVEEHADQLALIAAGAT